MTKTINKWVTLLVSLPLILLPVTGYPCSAFFGEGTTDKYMAKSYDWNFSHGFLMVNKRGASVAGKTPEEVIGKTDYDYHSKEAADGFREMDLKVQNGGKPITYKLKVQTPEGELTFIDHKFPVSVEGHPNSVGGIAIDVTDVEG